MTGKNLFILAGNGPYSNRGCEAIVRGTAKILRHHFQDPSFIVCSSFKNDRGLQKQQSIERDPDIIHSESWGTQKRFDFAWFATNVLRRTYPGALKYLFWKNLKPHLSQAAAVLSVGGDNYSIDYGRRPIKVTALDDIVTSHGKPLIIWGASVGPFTKDPRYEKYIIRHFRKVYIFARESLTQQYLNQHGLVDNVYRVADPAFLLESQKPDKAKLPIKVAEDAIGINISPLLAKYNSTTSKKEWALLSAKIVDTIIAKTKCPVYLIPHVTGVNGNCDYSFLLRVADLLSNHKKRVYVIPDTLNAAESKWLIGQMNLFIGARTHSTIASLSSGVPTLSFGYSIKSQGINRDIYGHNEYCIHASNLEPNFVADKSMEMLKNSNNIKRQIQAVLPKMKGYAMNAGESLKNILNK